MLKGSSILAALLLMMSLSSAHGQKYSVEPINAPPEADVVSEELRKEFATEGIRIKRGARRTACNNISDPLCQNRNWLTLRPDSKLTIFSRQLLQPIKGNFR